MTERLADLDLEDAVPHELPDQEAFDPPLPAEAFDSGPTELLRRANVWASALQCSFENAARPERWPGHVMTTCGFAHVDGRVRLAAIVYMQPAAAFRLRLPTEIRVAGGCRFPVIVRPWLVQHHGFDAPGAGGTCWVEMPTSEGPVRGILTAAHAIRPEGASVGSPVTIEVSRPEPPGRLAATSPRMDAAVVEVEERNWGERRSVTPSPVVGYKPVRVFGAASSVDADIVEHDGFSGATIPAQPRHEPRAPAQLILNRYLNEGDSGCLGVDLEFAEHRDPPPYLLYQGMTNLRWGGVGGYGLMLEQPRRIWDLQFYL